MEKSSCLRSSCLCSTLCTAPLPRNRSMDHPTTSTTSWPGRSDLGERITKVRKKPIRSFESQTLKSFETDLGTFSTANIRPSSSLVPLLRIVIANTDWNSSYRMRDLCGGKRMIRNRARNDDRVNLFKLYFARPQGLLFLICQSFIRFFFSKIQISEFSDRDSKKRDENDMKTRLELGNKLEYWSERSTGVPQGVQK